MTSGEKLAVNLLRGSNNQESGRCAETVFRALAQRAGEVGMTVQPASSHCLGYDEAKLLASLTLLQRQNADQLVDVEPALHSLLCDAAAALSLAGVRLNYRNIVRASASAPRHPSAARLQTLPFTGKEASVGDPFGSFAVQAQIFHYVDTHGAVWFRELHRQGATRHLISMMCRRGLLRRVKHGVYSAGYRGGKPSEASGNAQAG